jgi:hypothetical protein
MGKAYAHHPGRDRGAGFRSHHGKREPDGETLYLAEAERGDPTWFVEADSEPGPMIKLKKAVPCPSRSD